MLILYLLHLYFLTLSLIMCYDVNTQVTVALYKACDYYTSLEYMYDKLRGFD